MHRGRELPRRGGGAGRAAGAHDDARRQPHGRRALLGPAALVAWVIALELLLPLLLADLHALAASGGPAITVLLSSSAVFSALVLRSGEHPLVRLVLALYRVCLAAAT